MDERQEEKKKEPGNKKLIWIGLGVVLAMAAVTIAAIPLLQKLADPVVQEQFTAWVASLGVGGWFVVLGIQILQIVVAVIPGEPVELLAGVLYGGFGGLLTCMAGCLIATPLIFMLSRKLGVPLLEKLFPKKKLEKFAFLQNSRRLALVVFILFLIPGTPKDMLTYVAGVTPMKLAHFLPLTLLARIPSMLTSTLIGASVRQGNWTMAIVVFALTALIGILGILYHERVMAFCKRASKRITHKKGTQAKMGSHHSEEGV